MVVTIIVLVVVVTVVFVVCVLSRGLRRCRGAGGASGRIGGGGFGTRFAAVQITKFLFEKHNLRLQVVLVIAGILALHVIFHVGKGNVQRDVSVLWVEGIDDVAVARI